MSCQRDRIPVANPCADLAFLRKDIMAAIARVIDSGQYVLGSEVATLEKKLAQRLGTAGTVGVGSGTDALVIGLLALGIGPGDEVITVSHTAGATVDAVLIVGAVPVLVDIDTSTYCLDPKALDGALSSRTKAILPVHLYGHPAELRKICEFAREHDFSVIEDCAQAQEAGVDGRPVGSFGEIGCFSFYPTKGLGAIGDGGLVTASNGDRISRLRYLRTYGWTKPQFAEIPNGLCSRLDELQAAILNVKLDHLTYAVDRRRKIAHQYNTAFSDLPIVRPVECPGCRHVYHLYVIRCDRRNALAQHLDRVGIASAVHYPFPVHKQPAFAPRARIPYPLTVTESLASEILTLPLYPSMTAENIQRVIHGVRSFF